MEQVCHFFKSRAKGVIYTLLTPSGIHVVEFTVRGYNVYGACHVLSDVT